MGTALTSGETETVWTVVAGTQMHARVSGTPADEPVVVLVHGLVVSARYMISAMKRLALRHRVYAPDLPGFGKSGKPTRAADVPGLSDALACWMRKLDLGRSALVGNSMGCKIIVALAVRHPSGAWRTSA
jgi:2-hydroxy-6-oxonona-2,4-dienedioate hydrolase